MTTAAASAAARPTALAEVGPLLRLAVPIVVSLAAATLIGVTDTIMIAPLGTVPLAAASLTGSVVVLFYAAIYGFLSALGVGIAEAHGARDPRRIAGLVRNGLVLGGLVGAAGTFAMLAIGLAVPLMGQPDAVVAVLAPYWISIAALLVPFSVLMVFRHMFDAIGRPWLGVAFSFLAVAVNVPLNVLLIYGVAGWPGLGLTGAGIASFVAETVACAAAWAWWRRARGFRRMRVRVPVSRGAVAAAGREGTPLGLAYLGETGAYSLVGLMLGWFGAAALAANQVVSAVGTVIYMLPLGMAAAVTIRIGQARGAGETDRLRSIARAAIAVVLVWMVAMTAILLVLREPIATALADDPAVVSVAIQLFLVVAVMQVADGVQSTAFGALRGLGDGRWPSIASLVAYWLIALPAAYVAGFVVGLGPAGVWMGFGAGLAVAALALTVRLSSVLSRPQVSR
jgi:multidrug resistance protein, MATE family